VHRVEIVSQLETEHMEQLPRLLDAAARSDGHEPLGEHKFLRLQRGDDLALAILAFEGGELAGYAHTVTYGDGDLRRASCELVVDPAQRRRGVGRTLLSHAMTTAQAKGALQLDLWAYNDTDASQRMAGQFGFTPARRLLHLHRHMRSVPPVQRVAGATLRAVRPGVDDEAWLALNNRIFAGHPENGQWTLDDLRARMAQPWFRADDALMLEVDGNLVGFCWLKVEERQQEGRVGEIYVIGTAPEYQGRGLGRFLLASALAHLRTREATAAAIYVDQSNEAAVGLYNSNGFHYHHVDVCYTRSLRAEDLIGTRGGAVVAGVVAA
jgi:mycothiol synthase